MRRAELALALAFVALSFAANSLVTRYVVGGGLLDAGLLSAVRFLAGALVLGIVLVATRGRGALRFDRRHAWAALWLGAYAFLISYGYRFIPASAGTFVFYAAVFLTLAATAWPPPRRVLVGGALALAGLGVLAASSLPGVTPLGVVLLGGTGVAWGLYTAAGRGQPDPLAFTALNFLALAAALVVPTVAFVALGHPHVTGAGLAWGAAMGAGTTAFAYVAWYACQKHLSAGEAALHQLSVPLLTAIGAVALLGETISWRLGVAGALVIAGLAVGARR